MITLIFTIGQNYPFKSVKVSSLQDIVNIHLKKCFCLQIFFEYQKAKCIASCIASFKHLGSNSEPFPDLVVVYKGILFSLLPCTFKV